MKKINVINETTLRAMAIRMDVQEWFLRNIKQCKVSNILNTLVVSDNDVYVKRLQTKFKNAYISDDKSMIEYFDGKECVTILLNKSLYPITRESRSKKIEFEYIDGKLSREIVTIGERRLERFYTYRDDKLYTIEVTEKDTPTYIHYTQHYDRCKCKHMVSGNQDIYISNDDMVYTYDEIGNLSKIVYKDMTVKEFTRTKYDECYIETVNGKITLLIPLLNIDTELAFNDAERFVHKVKNETI